MKLITILASGSVHPLFFLRGKSSSYVMGVHEEGFLCHLHWGNPVTPDESLAGRIHRREIAFSPSSKRKPERKTGLDVLHYEFPTSNTGDFRTPALDIRHADGTFGLRLLYSGYRLLPGKPGIPGLPATYVEQEEEAETLEIDLLDAGEGVTVTLSYTVFAGRDVIVRSARVLNRGKQPVTVTRALSASVDLEGSSYEMIHLPGAWARERWVERHPLHSGCQTIGSRRGASSHQHNPFFALVTPETTETHGEVWGFSLVYSGNHFGGADVDQCFNTRAFIGIHPEGFAWHLLPGEEFQTPEVVLAFSSTGLDGLSSQYHRLYRERLVRGHWRDLERPVLINNWEATYFDFTVEKLVEVAAAAEEIGIELFVMDDGWFGNRNDATSSLGDWKVNAAKLPEGLDDLAKRIAEKGLRFGLWFEPEMISPDSELYRLHPEWSLHVPWRERTEGRDQLVLDFSRNEVVDAVYDQMAKVLREAPITYVKWDMNRHLTEVASPAYPGERQGEIFHRHILGVYRFMERLTQEFPEVLFESCSGGGGRYDPGILHYMPQTWCSDNSDAIARLKIQHGTSLVYPPCTMGAHISAVPNHQMHRTTPMLTRGHVALAGQFGFELDLSELTREEIGQAKELTILAKTTRHLLRYGNFHRLADPFSGNLAAWMIVSEDRSEAIVTAVLVLADPNRSLSPLRLRNLDPAARYRNVSGEANEWPGDVLMEMGIPCPLTKDFESRFWHLRRI